MPGISGIVEIVPFSAAALNIPSAVTSFILLVPYLLVPEAKADGKKSVDAGKEITITDTVSYANLTPGKEYKIVGVLMDKSTGKAFKVNGETVISEVTFTPEKSNGKVEVEFTFDGSSITKETELVVFETLYRDGVEIATHADLEDEGQTVTVKVPETPKTSTPKTGDDRNYGVIFGLCAAALGGVLAGVVLKIKSRKEDDED